QALPEADEMEPHANPAEVQEYDVREVLDEEIARLPEKYRLPIVLCYLQGRTYTEAAEELGCPPGTVSGRRARARALLRRSLQGRGLPLSAAALIGLCPTQMVAASLVRITARAVCAGSVSARAAVLAGGVLQSMKCSHFRLLAAGFLCLVGIV